MTFSVDLLSPHTIHQEQAVPIYLHAHEVKYNNMYYRYVDSTNDTQNFKNEKWDWEVTLGASLWWTQPASHVTPATKHFLFFPHQ